MSTVVNLLTRELYHFAQVDRVLGLRGGTARRWIDGYTRQGKRYPPVVRPEPTGHDAVTWGEFVECRFLSEYRSAGVPMRHMRPVVERLREELDTDYPLASSQLWLEPHGRELVARIQGDLGRSLSDRLWVVRTNQELLPIDWTEPARAFLDATRWDGGQIEAVHPLADTLVEINPRRAFGEPVVAGRSVRTEVLYELVTAGDPIEMVAELYELTVDQVNSAVTYERGLAFAA